MQWNEWDNVVMIERVKLICLALRDDNTHFHDLMQLAIDRMQQAYGGKDPVLMITSSGDTDLGKLMTTHMQKITEPGATAMWHGWFTSHWSTAIVAIIKQCNPAIKEDKARRIAKKTAKALRNTQSWTDNTTYGK